MTTAVYAKDDMKPLRIGGTYWLLTDHSQGVPKYFALDRKQSGGMGAACWLADKASALRFARQQDAEKFGDAYFAMIGARATAHNDE